MEISEINTDLKEGKMLLMATQIDAIFEEELKSTMGFVIINK